MDEIIQIKNNDQNSVYKEFYPVNPPFGYIGIQVDDDTGKKIYNVIEPTLSEDEQDILRAIKEAIIINVGVPLKVLKNDELMKKYLDDMIKKIINKYKKEIPLETDDKLKYYLMRDFMGYGKIDLLFHDPNIEDISCNGFNTPIYIWHRVHESLSTNIIFPTREELNFVVNRLVYKTGNQISIANPILEGTLPEGYRAHITLDEVSRRGDSFTIRKYRPNPFTVVDLIQLGTISPRIAAYTWILVEYLRSMMVCGAVASGKTALLNSISMFIKPEMKVVTIEEVRELRLHENWIPMTTRPSYQPGIQEITLFDLLRSALRQRPDYIIVGEVRGEEAYTLFQSIAVGHGGLCSIHADSEDSVIKRLITRPMDIPPMMLPLMNSLIQIRRVTIKGQIARRVDSINEIVGIDPKTNEAILETRFKWDSATDTFEYQKPKNNKGVFKLISEINQVPVEKLNQELDRRETILKWMVDIGVKDYDAVATNIRNYYHNPEEVYNIARLAAK